MNDSTHPLYRIWRGMLARCQDTKNAGYKSYGGRGITVCERWQTFRHFAKDMGARPAGKSLDRRNNDGNYEPGNCRWATPTEQNRNRRDNVILTIGGRSQTLAAWAEEVGVPRHTIDKRIASGKTGERLIEPSVYQSKRTHCAKGHEYTPENTARYPARGVRVCLTCNRRTTNIAYHKRQAKLRAEHHQ